MTKSRTPYFKGLLPLAAILMSLTSTHALHANKKKHRLPVGDVASHSIVKLIIGNSSCTGSFISKRSILTAAHCVPMWGTSENLTILTYDGSEPKVAHEISWDDTDMEAHPNYDFLTPAADISLVKSDMAVITLRNEVPEAKPVILYTDLNKEMSFAEYADSLEGSSFYLAGNGSRQRLFRSGLRATLDFVKSITKQTTAELVESEDHVLHFKTKRGTKVCQGDSGGPAFLRAEDGTMIQVGVVSIGYTGRLWAKNCGREVLYSAVGGDNLAWALEAQSEMEAELK